MPNNKATLQEIQKYWDRSPCNVNHSKLPAGTLEFFTEVTQRRYFVEPHILKFLDLNAFKGKKVLEIGAGIGTDAAMFAENGAEYHGIELSPESLSLARKRFELFHLQGSFTATSVEDLNLKSMGIFSPDLVYSFGVIHHTIDPRSALENVVKQVEKGCRFKLMVYAKNSWKMAMIEAGLDQHEAQSEVPIAFSYTIEEAVRLVKESGLKVEKICQDHVFMYNVEKYRAYNYELEPWFANMPMEIKEALKSKLGWHLLIDAVKV